MRIFENLSHSLVINWIEKEISVNFLEIFFVRSFTISSARFSEFDSRNVILFQIKVFGSNIKETTLARYFIKVAARPSFTRLRLIRQVNKIC